MTGTSGSPIVTSAANGIVGDNGIVGIQGDIYVTNASVTFNKTTGTYNPGGSGDNQYLPIGYISYTYGDNPIFGSMNLSLIWKAMDASHMAVFGNSTLFYLNIVPDRDGIVIPIRYDSKAVLGSANDEFGDPEDVTFDYPVTNGQIIIRALPNIVEINASAVPTNDTVTSGKLNATVKDASNNPIPGSPVTWSQMAGQDVIEIAADGSYTVKKAGSFSVTATADDDPTKTVTQTYTIAAAPADVSFSGITTQVSQGATGTLTAVVKDKNGVDITSSTTINWELSTPDVITLATPNAASTVWTATNTGDVTITLNATAGGVSNKTQTITVAVGKVPTAVKITNAPATTNDTATGTFTYNITYSDGTYSESNPVTWSAVPADILTIGTNGAWTANKAGTVGVTVAVQGAADINSTSTIIVEATPATVSFSGIGASVVQFANGTLTAVVKDKNGVDITTGLTLEWISDPVGNFTFTGQSGSTVTWNATKTGSAAIKLNATAGGISTESSATPVTVTKSVTSLVIAGGPAAATNDTATGTFTATITYSDGTTDTDVTLITWTSSDNTTLGVDANGNWQAKKAGTATITGTISGVSDTTGTITIAATPAEITISGITASLKQDQTGTASAVVKDKNGAPITTPVTWATNNSSVITINTAGVWTAVAKGTANISASATAGGITKQQNFTISVVNIPKTIEITGVPADLRRGGNAQLTATVKDDEGTVIVPDTTVWTSKNTGIFTVSSTGLITAVAPGTANISVSATALGTTVTNETPVTVKPDAGVIIDQPLQGSEHKAGQPVQFNATPLGLDNIASYAWTFGDGNTANSQNVTHTYDELTGLGAKTVLITVTYDGSKTVSREIGITLIKNDSRAVSVEINTAPEYVYAGKNGTLGATVKDQYGAKMETGATVQWASNDTGVISVSGSTWDSQAAGFAKITATVAENTSVTASRDVEVVAPAVATTVVITGTPDKMSIGSSAVLTALVLDQNSAVMPDEAVDWTSSNTAAVTVGTDGTIRAVGAGTATITATAKSSPSATADVTVIVVSGPSPVLTSVTITGAAQNLYIGDTLSLGILALDQDGAAYTPSPSITWTSGDEGILTVAADGTVIAVADGTTTITAEAAGSITDQVTITVSATPRPATQTLTSVTVTPATASLYPQKTAAVAAVALDENSILFTNETVTWTWASDNESTATVSGTGTITAHAAGSATITATATAESGASVFGTVAVTVKTPPSGPDTTPSSVKITGASSLTVLEGTGGTLKAVVLNSDDILLPTETVTWSSSSDTIVIIDATAGTYRAKSVGGATVTATSVTNPLLTATITFTVKKNPDLRTPSGITISAPSSLIIGQTGTASAVVKDQYGNTLTGETILWSSDNTGIADISSSGIITAKSAGTASLKAAVFGYESVNASQTLTVTNTPGPTPTSGGGGSGGGYSGTISASISGAGSVDFGLSHGITGVSFAKGTTGTVVLDTKPTGVSGPGKMHSVADITAPRFEGSAEISFAVPVSVLRDQGLGVNDVALHHYVNGQWVKLPTFFVGEDRGAAKYVAQTTGFSPFAIVYEKNGAQTVERSTPQPTKDTGTSVTAKPTASNTPAATSATAVPTTSAIPGGATVAPTLTQAPAPVAGVLLGLLAAAGVLIRRRE